MRLILLFVVCTAVLSSTSNEVAAQQPASKYPPPDHWIVISVKAENGGGFAMMSDGTIMGWGANMIATGLYHQTYSAIKITQVPLSPVARGR